METPDEEENSNKLGIFYYNKDDKRVLVPKSFGFGWTLNFANPWSYIILILFIGLVITVKYFRFR